METNAINTTAGSDTKSALQLLNEARIKQVSKEFESIFTTMMLKSMRSTVQTDGDALLPSSLGQKIYTEMLDDEYGKLMTDHSSAGIASLIEKQLLKQTKNDASPLAMLAGLKMQSWQIDNKFLPRQQTATAGSDTVSAVAQWNTYINQAANTYNLDPRLISAVITQESGGNPSAVSPKGAKGLMQLMDSTAADLGVKRSFDPGENIMGGAKYLRQMLDLYNNDETLALAAYNAGPSAVNQYKGLPPYPETQQYVSSVIALKDKFTPTAASAQPQGIHQ